MNGNDIAIATPQPDQWSQGGWVATALDLSNGKTVRGFGETPMAATLDASSKAFAKRRESCRCCCCKGA